MRSGRKRQPGEISLPSEGEGDKHGNQEIIRKEIVEEVFGQEVIGEEIFEQKEIDTEVFSERGQERGNRDAGDEEGHAQERPQRQESDKPEAGDRNRALEGAQRRQEGAEEEVSEREG
jgi:hypothetical protein